MPSMLILSTQPHEDYMNKLCTCRACGKLFSRKKPKPYCSPLCRLTHNNTHNTNQSQTTSILEGATSNDRNTNHS